MENSQEPGNSSNQEKQSTQASTPALHGPKAFFTRLWHNVRNGLSRMAAASVLTLCACVALVCASLVQLLYAVAPQYQYESDIVMHWLMWIGAGFWLGVVAAAAARLACERYCNKNQKCLQWLPFVVGTLAALVGVALMKATEQQQNENLYAMLYLGLFAALLCASFWLLYTKENADTVFPWMVKSTLFACTVSVVLTAGICICLAAVDMLLLETPYEIYGAFIIVIWALVFPNLVLAYIPKAGEELPLPKIYHILTGYVALPVYLLLLAVLYGYLFKIVATRHMPSGEMNWFASFALMAFLVFWVGLRAHPSALVQKFVRWGWVLLPAVMAVQILGIFIRLSAYGLTTLRYLSLACLAVGIVGIVLAALGRGPRALFAVLAAAALVVTVTPLNALDIPVMEQTARLERLLRANGMYDGATLTQAAAPVSQEDSDAIRSAAEYISDSDVMYYRVPSFAQMADEKSLEKLGLAQQEDTTNAYLYLCYTATQPSVSTVGYSAFYELSYPGERMTEEGQFTLDATWDDGTTVSASLQPMLSQLLDAYGMQDATVEPKDLSVVLGDGRELVFSQMFVTMRDGEIDDVSYTGYLLVP